MVRYWRSASEARIDLDVLDTSVCFTALYCDVSYGLKFLHKPSHIFHDVRILDYAALSYLPAPCCHTEPGDHCYDIAVKIRKLSIS